MSEKPESKKKKILWTSEKILSISALVVSVVSVVALLYQLSLSREENELIRQQQSANVRPHLTFGYSNNSREYSIRIINKGVGPAFVKKVEYTVNDSLKFNRSDFFFNYIKDQKSVQDSGPLSVSTYSFMKGDVLTANSEISIFSISGSKEISLFRQSWNALEWNYVIVYEDIYGAKWKLISGEDFPIPVTDEAAD